MLLLAATACTQDEPGGQGNELPYGEYPLQISGVTLDVESSAEPWSTEEPQTRVAENDNGTGSVWQWDGSEKIRVQLGDETADYTLNVGPILTADKQLYWTSTAPATVTARYPTDETVNLSDQSNALAYVLKAEAPNAAYNNEITLSFKHQLAKVRVVLSGTQTSLAQSVEVYGYTTYTNNEGVPTAVSTQGWLKMKNTTYADGTECWEANVVPGTIDLANFIRLNGHAVVEKDNLTDVPEVLNAAKMYTINLTVGEKITDIKDNTTISDDGYYRVSGTFNQQINITGGKPTIYLKGASINVSDGPAISITGGTPTIHVIEEGNSTADVLTANGGSSGSIGSGTGIGSPVGGTQGGNIIIRNLTVHATGGGNNNVSGAGIGSSTNGACGDITIEDAVIVATGGDCAAGIGMGCNYWNSTTGSIGKITITDSDVTASGGYGAAAIGFSLSELFSGSGDTYRAGRITITTEDEAGFLSKLKPGMAPGFSLTPQRIGKGAYNLTPTFLNTAGTGLWEGVVINGTSYQYGVQ
ncbi:MAG TPA: fimbrillin family protein [Candidatus Cryptobacteroides merdipullorum]|uniref:Fimbrillin family protein n=1 Tax=Candidatus Cryptobacteroides merdipullorum TaxID=2840771 RepID=A0A9D1KH37_9BACT|nr:fimbrillin family protein [Candidatus Cryptobacteroides merdipullorum]